jgi:malate dehydrogenase (oxaloacetate-decarboxylating)(NADP+)
MRLGVRKENILVVDSKGVLFEGRTEGMNEYKAPFAVKTDKRTLAEAFEGADVFVGLSVKGLVTPDMVASMAKDPIIFALANPDPEILPEEVAEVRDDAIMATGVRTTRTRSTTSSASRSSSAARWTYERAASTRR